MMTKQRRENEAQRLVNATMALLKEDDYLKSRNERKRLAGLYKEYMALSSNFPQMGASKMIPAKLEKKVSASCGSCVKPAQMRLHIRAAIKYCRDYSALLQSVILADQKAEKKTVHELTPTKDEN